LKGRRRCADCRPILRGLLWVGIDEQNFAALEGELGGQVEGKRGFPTAPFLVDDC